LWLTADEIAMPMARSVSLDAPAIGRETPAVVGGAFGVRRSDGAGYAGSRRGPDSALISVPTGGANAAREAIMPTDILFVFALILLNGLFAMSVIAIVSSRQRRSGRCVRR
jgi:hypothetical protein